MERIILKLDNIQMLMNQFEDSDIRELQIDDGDFHLYLSKNKSNTQSKTTLISNKETVPVEKTKEVSEEEATTPVKNTDTAVPAPIVGIVYLQPRPGKPTYVEVGQHINKGDTICIIEAMKMMTEVKSQVSGTVTQINVENEDLVEVDQPLIMVKED